ncbi:YitT family protein [Paenibacillus sp. J22TS3]|uniref:YitT family protein n=1 Tax=Paenibacillus sp. J22TS3 TaxID=2807192 RepID=UPI001B2B167E|nr:YitT family protein [Paenibacillus sp. J22TS3]GIP20283.1 membrane protein [Paenibacillus sp. J22TS3]
MRKDKRWLVDTEQLVLMLIGTFLLAFTYYHINFQNHLSEGGFVGLSLLGKYLFNFPPAVTALVLDIPVFILALILKGRKFLLNTIIGSLAFSGFYELCDRFSPLHIDLHNNLLLAAILSGLFTGIGAGVVLRAGGATGGDDILSLLLSQLTGLKIGTVFIALDAVVLLISLIYLPMMETLFTVVAVLIAGKVITWTVNYGRSEEPKLRVPVAVKEKTARA